MKDVALAAGVSRATVSLALRNDRSIAATTRSRIYAVAEKLGYKTNPLVSALMSAIHARRLSQKHTVLAYVTTDPQFAPWRTWRMFIEMEEGAHGRAEELGYRLEEFPLRSPGMTPKRYLQMLQARGILGLLIAPLPYDERVIELDFADFAVVGIDMSVASPLIERVSNDHFQSALLAVQKCRELGYRRIGFVLSRTLSRRLEHRWLAGVRIAEESLPPRQRIKLLMPETGDAIMDELPAWYTREKPEVIIMSELNPNTYYGIPPKIGLVSLSLEEPIGTITGIFQDNRRMGGIAIEHLVARLERCEFGPDDRGRLHMVAGQWVPGKTALGPGIPRAG